MPECFCRASIFLLLDSRRKHAGMTILIKEVFLMRKHFILLLATACCIWAVNAYARINLDSPPEVPPDLNSRDFMELTATRESLTGQFDATLQKIDAQAENCHSVEKGSPKAAECAAQAQEVKSAVKDYRAALERFRTRLADETIPLLRQPGEIENQKGGRYIDCDSIRQFYDRASSSLSSQKDAIERTQAQIDGAKKATQEDYEELEHLLLKSMSDSARDMMSSSGILKERLSRMKADGMSHDQRLAWLKAMKSLDNIRDSTDKIASEEADKAFKAGYKFPEEFKKSRDLKESVLSIHKLLKESGIYEEGAKEVTKKLATTAFGPMGLLIYSSSKLTIDAGILAWRENIDEGDLQQAQNTYDNLKYQLSQMQEKLDNARLDLTKYCGSGQGVVVAP